MAHLPPLEELDVDGAIREAADKVDPETRASFLRKAGLGAGAVVAGGAFSGVLPALARGATIPRSDIDILNFALTLEFLEAAFYGEARVTKALTGETLRFAQVVGNHEESHVKLLQRVLGSRAVKKPKFDFKGTTKDMAKFQATADVLEDTGVKAYLGQVGNLRTKAILVTAGQIATVEARHAAWIRDIRFSGGTTGITTPAPVALDKPLTKRQILAAVGRTGFIVG